MPAENRTLGILCPKPPLAASELCGVNQSIPDMNKALRLATTAATRAALLAGAALAALAFWSVHGILQWFILLGIAS